MKLIAREAKARQNRHHVAKTGMSYARACLAFGNGDFRRGKNIILAIAERLNHAREKHPFFAEGQAEAVGVIMAEAREMEHALEHETAERVIDESLDVIATIVRLPSRIRRQTAAMQSKMGIAIRAAA